MHYSQPEHEINVDADATRIEQAIMNLVTNAIKFTPAGGDIFVSLAQTNGEAKVVVQDTGSGISQEDLSHIFEMYYQGRKTHSVAGLGIGLYLVNKIMKLHHGKVSARSEGKGKGSEFTVTLPLSSHSNSTQKKVSEPESSASGLSVLIVDDNRPAADSLARLLNALGEPRSF